MNRKIHFQTIQKAIKERLGVDVDTKEFINNQTGEVYNIIFEKGTDVALFSMRGNDEYICLNSNGDEIDKEKIYSYINGINVKYDNGKMLISENDLVLRCREQIIDIEELVKRESELFPERTNIVLRGMFEKKGFSIGLTNFYVDEIVHVNEQEFNQIRDGYDSDILVKYNEKTYGHISDGEHGLLVIGPDSDGIMVATKGYDFAMCMSYAPQIGMPIQYMINKQMREDAVHEIKLYVPMTVIEADEEENEVKVNGLEHYDVIKDAIEKTNAREDERCLANHLENEKLKSKVYSIKPELTIENQKLMAVAVIRLTKPLEYYEVEELKDYCSAQFSDGWGESSHFDGIRTDGTHLFVHFMDEAEDKVMTEEELSNINQEQGMQGIQGMSGM